MFEPIMGKTIDAYIDDIMVKSKNESDHVRDLTEVFTILKKHKLRLNVAKCTFGGELRKVPWALGHYMRDQGEPRTYYDNQ